MQRIKTIEKTLLDTINNLHTKLFKNKCVAETGCDVTWYLDLILLILFIYFYL